jgi:hypothetical protein
MVRKHAKTALVIIVLAAGLTITANTKQAIAGQIHIPPITNGSASAGQQFAEEALKIFSGMGPQHKTGALQGTGGLQGTGLQGAASGGTASNISPGHLHQTISQHNHCSEGSHCSNSSAQTATVKH